MYLEFVRLDTSMDNISTIVEVSEEKKVNIRTFYLIGKAYICCSTMKDSLLGPKFTGVNL